MDRTAHLVEYPAITTPAEHITVIGPTHFAWLTEDLSEDGQLGDPRLAELSRGEKIVELTVEKLARVLTEMAVFEMPRPARSRDDTAD